MRKISRFYIELIAIAVFALALRSHFSKDAEQLVIASDGKGYYAYLPAVFIYHDPRFTFINKYESRYYQPVNFFEFRNDVNGQQVDKYFSGVAILLLPFFLIAHLLAQLLHLPADGYSPIYQGAVAAGAAFYLYLGLKALHRLLLHFSRSRTVVMVVIGLVLMGTNLLYYSAQEQSMSHVYSFSLICIFCYSLYRICFQPSRKWIVIGLAVLGLIVTIRPVNIMVLGMLPVMAGSKEAMKRFFFTCFQQLRYTLAGLLLALVPVFFQMYLWHWQTGHWIFYTYGKEGFIWTRPVILHLLFSYRKGWFVYTPMALIGVLGLFLWFRKDPFRCISSLLVLALILYVTSCWWTWSYGMSFGQRALIDFYVLLAIGLLQWVSLPISAVVPAFLAMTACLYITLIQTYQYKRYILLWDGMDKKDYWRVFLKTHKNYEGILWMDMKDLDYKVTKNIRASFKEGFEQPGSSDDGFLFTNEPVYEGKSAEKIDKHHAFGKALKMPLQPCDSVLQASVMFYNQGTEYSVLVAEIKRNGKTADWKSMTLLPFARKNNTWTEAILHAPLSGIQQGDTANVYVWNADTREKVIIDQLKADVIATSKCR